jgi:DNA (cytosine-5)-methyltransferase 1
MTESLKLIDTFSGIGGFSYAAEKLVGGFKTVAFVECESYCQKVLKKHWPDVPIYDDIKSYRPEPYSADVICGGFPCQSISNLGHHEGITETSKSGLFYELMRVIRLVLGELAEAGFDCEWACIPASALGACHKRERIWIIAYPMRERSQRATNKRVQGKGIWAATSRRLYPNWRQYESQPVLRRGDDGLSRRVDRLKALGNSIVPQVAAIPLQRTKELSLLQSITIQSQQ